MAWLPDWPKLYRERVGGAALGRLRNTGAISTREVAAELACALAMEVDAMRLILFSRFAK
jgi:hypothetical protein